MSTPLSYVNMREDEGYKPAIRFKQYKTDNARPIAAILSLNTIANTIGAAGVGAQANQVFGSMWFGVVSAVTTILILVFAEIIPKTIGTSQWKHLMALPLPPSAPSSSYFSPSVGLSKSLLAPSRPRMKTRLL